MKHKKIINLFNKTIINKINIKKNNDIKFKLKKKKMISFKIMMMMNEKNIMMKKEILIKNNNFYIFKIFNMKNLIKQISTKYYINNIILILNLFKTLTFNVKIFLK